MIILFCISQTAVFSEDLENLIDDGSIQSQIRFFSMERDYKEFKENSEGDFKLPYYNKKVSNAIGGYVGLSRETITVSVQGQRCIPLNRYSTILPMREAWCF